VTKQQPLVGLYDQMIEYVLEGLSTREEFRHVSGSTKRTCTPVETEVVPFLTEIVRAISL
jgi:hypothetical protein